MRVEPKVVVVDAYNVVTLLARLGSTFDEIASLGFYLEGEGQRKMTGKQLEVWYEEEDKERSRAAELLAKGRAPKS